MPALPATDSKTMRFDHTSWLRDQVAPWRDTESAWETAQAMREMAPALLAAAARVSVAETFPIEPQTGFFAKFRVKPEYASKRGMSPKDFIAAELTELFAEKDAAAARARGQSLEVMAELVPLTAQAIEKDCCEQWYAGGRAQFAKLAPDATALQLAMAGAVTLSIFLQLSATEPEGGQVKFEAGKHFDVSFKYLTEPDTQVMLAASTEETFAAIRVVQEIFLRDLNNRAQVAA